MKYHLVTIAATALLLFAPVCHAQFDCTDYFTSQQFECADGEGCNSSVDVWVPHSTQYGEHFNCSSVNCCGQLFTSCAFSGGGICDPFGKRPEFKKEVDQLAMVSDLLVQDCQGRYVPYTVARMYVPKNPARMQRHGDFLDDRIGMGVWR